MRSLLPFAFFCLVICLPSLTVEAQAPTPIPASQVEFDSPVPGQVLQGTVLIIVKTHFGAAEGVKVSFAYQDDPRDTWFVIHEEQNVDQQEFSFEWDTTTITDGDYDLRLVASTSDSEYQAIVPGLRVRNYSAVETNTPVPTSTMGPQDTSAASSAVSIPLTPALPTATSLPTNPAQITRTEISYSILKGALITLVLFAVLGSYQFIRGRKRN